MVRWEYLRKIAKDLRQAELNKLGADGWELVAINVYSDPAQSRYVFKRPLMSHEVR